MVAEVPSATLRTKSDSEARPGSIPDVHHTCGMKRVRDAAPDTEGKALVDVHHSDESPEHVQDSRDLNDHGGRGYRGHE